MANISETSINRPVLSTVMMLVILLFGFIGYRFLGVREFPSVDQPIISVNVSYPGANADVIMNQITEPLEQNINGIPGIRSLSSVSCPTLPSPRLRPAYGIESGCRCLPDHADRHPKQQTLVDGVERDRRANGERALADHREREWRGYLGTKTVFHASMAGPNQDGGLRSDPDGREKRRR